MAGKVSEPSMAPSWLPVWRIENIRGRCSGRDRRASSAELAGVSGPNAKPRMAPASDQCRRARPCIAVAMAAATARAHSAATGSYPSRAASMPPAMEVATPTMNTLVVKREMSRSPMPSLGASTPGRTGRGRPGPAAPSWRRAPAPVAASAACRGGLSRYHGRHPRRASDAGTVGACGGRGARASGARHAGRCLRARGRCAS